MSFNSNYLAALAKRIDQIQQDVPKLTQIGEQMATHLLSGGNIFVPPVSPYWASEFTGRAGGLMGIRTGDYAGPYQPNSDKDVAYLTLPRKWTEKQRTGWTTLVDSPARIYIIGDESEVPADLRSRISAITSLGDPAPSEHPGVRPFEQLVRGWLVAGEMVAACTRAGKMPHIWMSVWLEGAMVRNASFFKHDNLREPWHVPLFHERIYIPPLAPGHVAAEFLRELTRIHATLLAQSEQLSRATQWIAEAKRAGKRVSMVAVGHAYPELLESDPADLPVTWSKSISHVSRAHPTDLGSGDLAIHFGYAPVDVPDITTLLERDVRFIYTSPYGRPNTLANHPNLLWLDLPWRPADATVDVPGYSVRILPMSSSAHTMAYFSIV